MLLKTLSKSIFRTHGKEGTMLGDTSATSSKWVADNCPASWALGTVIRSVASMIVKALSVEKTDEGNTVKRMDPLTTRQVGVGR